MRYRLAVEDIEPNHYVAWVLDLPGCFSSGLTKDEVITKAPTIITEYYEWLQTHDTGLPVLNEPVEIEVVEQFEAFVSDEDPDYVVNAFFEDDKRALSYWDVEVMLRLLTWSRQDLLKIIESLDLGLASETIEEVNEILAHIAGAENWYFGHFNLGIEGASLPDNSLERLSMVRENTRMRLIEVVGDAQVVVCSGEVWSARKIGRRTLWHERDHTRQIAQLLADD